MTDVTQLLDAAAAGDPRAASKLLPLVYDELRRLAAIRMAAEPAGHTLDPTALVHEAYIRLVKCKQPQDWNGRGHFFAAAGEAMRRILVESARRKKAEKHGGGWQRIDIDQVALVAEDDRAERIIAVDEVLDRLAAEDPEVADVVNLRFFVGLTLEQIATALGRSLSTVNRDLAYARAWLSKALDDNSAR